MRRDQPAAAEVEHDAALRLDARHGAGPEVGAADEAGREHRRGSAVDLERRAGLHDPPLVHHDDAIGHAHGLLLVVGHVDERDAERAVDLLQLDLDLAPHLEVERGQRLVEQEHLRTVDERARQGDPLRLAAGQRRDVALGELRQAHELEVARHELGDLRLGHPAQAQPERHVVEHVEMREQRHALEHEVHGALVGRQPRDVPAVDEDAAVVREVEAGDHAQERRLAAPARSEQAHELALGDVEVERLHGVRPHEAPVDALDLDEARVRLVSHAATLLIGRGPRRCGGSGSARPPSRAAASGRSR